MKVYASSGGGIRIGATFGAIKVGEDLGKFQAIDFETYLGTSAGALDALLTANGWNGQQKGDLFLNTDFASFFTTPLVPFKARKAMAVLAPMRLEKLANWIDGLGLSWPPGLIINAVDSETNQQILYYRHGHLPTWATQTDPKMRWEPMGHERTIGLLITRSMVLPGLVADHPKFMDGGIAENPCLSILPTDTHILLMHLGYAGLVQKNGQKYPSSLIERSFYAYEFKAYTAIEEMMERFPKLKVIWPKVYDVDSTDFNLSRAKKQNILMTSGLNTLGQWGQIKS
jgi:predicted acylesterase/phospholipase RssA